jgi:hypothetical protein
VLLCVGFGVEGDRFDSRTSTVRALYGQVTTITLHKRTLCAAGCPASFPARRRSAIVRFNFRVMCDRVMLGSKQKVPQALSRSRSLGRIIIEFLLVVAGSLAAGWLIGTAQHYIAWGLWHPDLGRHDFSWGAVEFAAFEGGTAGLMAAIPTGLVAWLILCRHATVSEVGRIVLMSLVGGCALAVAFGFGSALLTPLLTEIVAGYTMKRRPVRPGEDSITS